MRTETTAVILAGGKSSRFGADKSLLYLNGQRIVERLVRKCAQFADEVLIVSNAPGKFRIPGVRELCDLYPDMGPLGGVHAGLAHAGGGTVFVTACDMPVFPLDLAVELVGLTRRYEATVPIGGGRLQPLFAAMRRDVALDAAEDLLKADQRRLRELYGRLDTCFLALKTRTEAQGLFLNINYPADYQSLLAGEKEVVEG